MNTIERSPLPPSLSVRAARDTYLTENGFDLSGYTADTFEVEAFGRRYTFPNSPDRKWAIPLHDLHHVATGYGTDLIGEAEVGAFELVGGCRTRVVYLLNVTAVLMGFFIAPLRTMSAFAHARGARALFRTAKTTDGLLDLSLGDLRARLGVPEQGLARAPRKLHDEPEGVPRQPWWVVALGLVNGLSTLGTVAWELAHGRSLEGVALEGGARWVAIAVGLMGALLAASAPSLRKGSLLGRSLFAHAALGLIALNVVSLVELQMKPALAAFACAVPVLLVGKLMRSG